MKLLEFFSQWRNTTHKETPKEEVSYMLGFQSGFEAGLHMATHVDRMALDMAKSEGIDDVIKRFSERGNNTNNL